MMRTDRSQADSDHIGDQSLHKDICIVLRMDRMSYQRQFQSHYSRMLNTTEKSPHQLDLSSLSPFIYLQYFISENIGYKTKKHKTRKGVGLNST